MGAARGPRPQHGGGLHDDDGGSKTGCGPRRARARGGSDRHTCPRGVTPDPEFLRLEIERLFPKTWLNACRFDEVERVGDYVDFEICDQSIVVVRTEQGLRAYFNACRHRGTRLVQGQGRIGEFRCPFHAWRWNLDGSLKYHGRRGEFRSPPGRGAVPARGEGRHVGRLGLRQHGSGRRAAARLPRPDAVTVWRATSSRTCGSPGTSR